MRVKFFAQGNNGGLWWGSNSRLTGIHRLWVRRTTHYDTPPLTNGLTELLKKCKQKKTFITWDFVVNMFKEIIQLAMKAFSFDFLLCAWTHTQKTRTCSITYWQYNTLNPNIYEHLGDTIGALAHWTFILFKWSSCNYDGLRINVYLVFRNFLQYLRQTP